MDDGRCRLCHRFSLKTHMRAGKAHLSSGLAVDPALWCCLVEGPVAQSLREKTETRMLTGVEAHETGAGANSSHKAWLSSPGS